jgi:anti-sigma factor RsiW
MKVDMVRRARDLIECMRIGRHVQAFVDGELDDGQRQRVAAHLDACRRCGLAESTYQALKRRLHGYGQPADTDAVARLERFIDSLADDSDG